ncbi:MAG: ABC transporter substrate-binding protein [Myxococcaceae bacterium]
MRRTSLGYVGPTLVLAALFASMGCEKKSTQTPVNNTTAQPATGTLDKSPTPAGDDVILLGEVGSLTGSEATFGISTRNGIEMALNEANAAGGVKGKKLAVRVYDDQGKPEEAANAVTRLINQDKVKLILGEVASSNSLAMAPLAQAAKVPMITPSSTNPKVTQVGDYIFRACFIDPFQGYVMAKFARENLKLNNVAILKDQKSAYSDGLTEVFAKKFAEMGGKIVGIEAYSKGDSDFRAQLTALKRNKPEGIYIPGYYTDVGVIARQARELALKSTLMGGDGWDSATLFELGGSAIENSYFSNHYSVDDPNPRVRKFVEDYKKAYGGVAPDGLAALGYDSGRLAVEALTRAKDLSGESIRDALKQIKDFPGAAGTISMDANRDAVKPAVVLQVTEGKTKFVATVNP